MGIIPTCHEMKNLFGLRYFYGTLPSSAHSFIQRFSSLPPFLSSFLLSLLVLLFVPLFLSGRSNELYDVVVHVCYVWMSCHAVCVCNVCGYPWVSVAENNAQSITNTSSRFFLLLCEWAMANVKDKFSKRGEPESRKKKTGCYPCNLDWTHEHHKRSQKVLHPVGLGWIRHLTSQFQNVHEKVSHSPHLTSLVPSHSSCAFAPWKCGMSHGKKRASRTVKMLPTVGPSPPWVLSSILKG